MADSFTRQTHLELVVLRVLVDVVVRVVLVLTISAARNVNRNAKEGKKTSPPT